VSSERSPTNPKERGVPNPLRKEASKRKINQSGEAITVGIRIRPLIAERWETKLELKECFVNELDRTVLEMDDAGVVTQSWSFDYVWGSTVSTQTVFDELAAPIVDKAVDGINGTIFAYGQTAAGKVKYVHFFLIFFF
jgi:centromeric protein E